MPEALRVLLVEDDDAQAELVEEGLSGVGLGALPDTAFAVERVHRAAEAVARLEGGRTDVVLLDLNLPDSTGLETFARLRAGAPDVPVVVLSSLDDAALGQRAVREGAQDYLVKGQAEGPLLGRSLLFAIERVRAERESAARNAAEAELAAARAAEERRQSELRAVARLAEPTDRTAEVTARSFGVLPVSQAAPARFAELSARYGELLDRALERRAYRVEPPTEDALRELAEALAFLRAGPRDVVELHAGSLRSKIDGATPQRAQAYIEEARLIVLELMGYLVQAYRR